MSEHDSRPPRDNLIRAVRLGVGMRAEDNGTVKPNTLFGHFAVFNRWTEIDSFFEGHFLERIAPGAFKKTFSEQGDSIRVLLEHGHDPQLGNKPIADPEVLREDDTGAYYEARLFDGIPALVVDGLRAGQYGASFRFSVMREEFVAEPGASDYNPEGLPERTLKELRVPEFGPVTFGAYSDATADVRSMTDDFIMRALGQHPERLRTLLEQAVPLERADHEEDGSAPSTTDAARSTGTSAPERRDPTSSTGRYGLTKHEQRPNWAL